MSLSELFDVASFGPEQAGQIVGWSSVSELPREHAEPYYVAMLVAAVVGEEGAELKEHRYEKDGKISSAYSPECAKGFLEVSGIAVTFVEETPFEGVADISFVNDTVEHRSTAATLLYGPSVVSSHDFSDVPHEWLQGSDEILGRLKSNLAAVDRTDYYQSIYYNYNARVGRDLSLRGSLEATAVEPSRNLPILADPEQHQVTARQAEVADIIASLLSSGLIEDAKTLDFISSNLSIDVVKWPSKFTSSRRKIAKYEQNILTAEDELIADGTIHLEVGSRPYGRTWPYMDPLVADEDRAFGQELAALRQGNSANTKYQLEKELKELKMRLNYARAGHASLTLLADAEQQVAKDDSE